MEKIDEQLNNLSRVGMPAGMHQSVMRKVNYRRIRPVLWSSFIFLACNFIIITWHINSKLIDAEFNDMMLDFFSFSDLSFSFVNTILGSFFEIVSPTLVLSLVLSLAGAIYTGKKIAAYKFFEYKSIKHI